MCCKAKVSKHALHLVVFSLICFITEETVTTIGIYDGTVRIYCTWGKIRKIHRLWWILYSWAVHFYVFGLRWFLRSMKPYLVIQRDKSIQEIAQKDQNGRKHQSYRNKGWKSRCLTNSLIICCEKVMRLVSFTMDTCFGRIIWTDHTCCCYCCLFAPYPSNSEWIVGLSFWSSALSL